MYIIFALKSQIDVYLYLGSGFSFGLVCIVLIRLMTVMLERYALFIYRFNDHV